MAKVKHKFTSAKADGTDTTFVKPSNWNADHDLTQDTKAVLGALAAGATVELPLVTSTGADDGTIWTKQAITEAIAAAVGALTGGVAVTGDIAWSMQDAKSGWLLLNGQTIGNVGSTATFANATAQALFNLFWAPIGGRQWPILNGDGTLGAKGASADADWIALKKFVLPDARGRALIMPDAGAGVMTTPMATGDPVGEEKHILQINELPEHAHVTGSVAAQFSGNSGSGGSFNYMFNGVGGLTGNVGAYTPHNNMQPSLGANAFIKL